MAIQIVSGNLNNKGNAGQYETDSSTWGFGSFTFSPIEIGRDSSTHSAGLQALYARVIAQTIDYVTNVDPVIFTAIAGVPITAGKKYIATAKVRTRTELPVGTDNISVYIEPNLSAGVSTIISQTVLTVFDIKDALATNNWFDLEIKFQATDTRTEQNLAVALELAGGDSLNLGNRFYVDQFEVYEYEDVVEPPTCTLEIDEDATVIVNETAPGANDGSITVATTGGSGGTYEFQMDGGAWQLSNLFAGVGSGLHTVKAREQATPTCEDTAVFSVNADTIDFDFTLAVTNETVSGANDGMITATVTGTGGPFTFAINGGAYQGPNSFAALAPGTYFITVKNAAGDTLTKQATVTAGVILFEKVFFSKNPVTYLKNAAAGWEALNNYRLYDDVRVEDVTGSSIYNSKLKVDQPPASDGSVLFSVRRAFRDSLKAIPPTLNQSTIVRLTDRLKSFRHYTGELQDDEVTPETLTSSNPFLVLMGGLSTLKFPQIDFFGSYLTANKKFMSWAPLIKTVDRIQEDYLNFWIYTPAITAIKLRIKAYFDDGTDQTSTVLTQNNVSYAQLYQIPVGTSNSGVLGIDILKNVVKYEVSLLDQADAVISEVRTFVISKIRHPRTRLFMFLNSMGTYEVHLFTGVGVQSTDYDGEPFERYLAPDYTEDDIQVSNDSVTFQNKGSFSSGYIKGTSSAEWLAYFRDMLRTSRFFDVTTGKRVPMVIMTRNLPYLEDQNHERFVRFDAAEAFFHESYTPESV